MSQSSQNHKYLKTQTNPKSQSTETDFHQKYGQEYSFQQCSQMNSGWVDQDKNSAVLKEDFSSINSQNSNNNITFAVGPEMFQKNKDKNLAYVLSSKYPPKIKKQVEQIISYYQNQLESQRTLFWRTVTEGKIKKNKQNLQYLKYLNVNKENNQEFVSNLDSNGQKNKLKQLQQKLSQKDQKIIQLSRQLMATRSKYENLKIQLSPTRSKRYSEYDSRD